MTRFAVVGMGLMGMLHARILRRLRGVEVVAAIDIDEARLALARQEFGVPTGRSLEDVIDKVDAASITLPDHLHVDACRLALQRGKAVLVEKPLATTAADCERILAARTRPEQLMVAHLLRFDLRIRELKRRLDAGAFGAIDYFRIHRANTRGGVKRLGGRASVTAFLGVH
ncbi:MAG: Gfo/Idh/MocA family oxidoreductase, partial [Alphaproteobacteria bacterium]|nr:Gfo/Idh/MocA family oxidoreductase [Alphaproteobacteria bacterium]